MKNALKKFKTDDLMTVEDLMTIEDPVSDRGALTVEDLVAFEHLLAV